MTPHDWVSLVSIVAFGLATNVFAVANYRARQRVGDLEGALVAAGALTPTPDTSAGAGSLCMRFGDTLTIPPSTGSHSIFFESFAQIVVTKNS